MSELLTAAQMRAIEQEAINSGAVTGLELMERAGRGVVEAILEWRPELALAPHRAVVLCGPGNNGGDGFVVARLLKQRGWEVEVFLYGEEAKLPPDAAENCRRWREMGEVWPLSEFFFARTGNIKVANLYVDALFGTGLTRPLPADINRAFSDITYQVCQPIISVDVPSGVCSDSGRILGNVSAEAELCVTFHKPKRAHLLDGGPDLCRNLKVKSLALAHSYVREPSEGCDIVSIRPTDDAWIDTQCLDKRRPYHPEHKYTHGHALVLAGPKGKTGAARLAARGALRIGAGLVTVAAPASALPECAAQLTAIMLEEVEDADALDGLLTDDRLNALCLGPGLGRGERTRALVRAALASAVPGLTRDLTGAESTIVRGPGSEAGAVPRKPRSIVLDADALTSFAGNPGLLFERLHENCVLTPHAGEFKRLFPDIMAKLEEPATKGPAYSKVDATREAAKRAGCTVLFKGPDTVIADQTGRAAINSAHYDRAAPWLATAGSGDVLAGFITGLLARGFSPMAASETAAWLHVSCALNFGPGLIAEDLPEQLPAVFRDLGL